MSKAMSQLAEERRKNPHNQQTKLHFNQGPIDLDVFVYQSLVIDRQDLPRLSTYIRGVMTQLRVSLQDGDSFLSLCCPTDSKFNHFQFHSVLSPIYNNEGEPVDVDDGGIGTVILLPSDLEADVESD